MSYDGDEGWHDWLRGIPGAGEAVLRAFDLCHDMGFPTGAELCIHQGNKHLLRESICTLAKHHCSHLKTNPVSETELWDRLGGDYAITMEETLEIYLDLLPGSGARDRIGYCSHITRHLLPGNGDKLRIASIRLFAKGELSMGRMPLHFAVQPHFGWSVKCNPYRELQ